MISDTKTPMLSLIEFLGLNPYYYAGITTDTTNYTQNKCMCLKQHPWQTVSYYTRDDLVAALKYAEDVFYTETGIHPATTQIESERLPYPVKRITKNPFINPKGDYKSVRLPNPCYFKSVGKVNIVFIDTLVVDKTKTDYFTVEFTKPAGYTNQKLRAYFSPNDSEFNQAPEYNDHEYEVRPIHKIEDRGETVKVYFKPYMLLKPSLYSEDYCHDGNDLMIYASDLLLYYEHLDTTQHGRFVFFNDACGDGPGEKYSDAYFETRPVGDETFLVPKPYTYTGGKFTSYVPNFVPSYIDVNYLSGLEVNNRGLPERFLSGIINKLAIGLLDANKDFCECDKTTEEKLAYYRKVPTEQADEGYAVRWNMVLSKKTVDLMSGYPSYLGLTMAFKEMRTYRCYNVEGGYV